MKQKRTVLSNPKVSKETAEKAKGAVKARVTRIKCPECNGGATCEYCSGIGTLPKKAHLYKVKELRNAKKIIYSMFKAEKNYSKEKIEKYILKMSYEELMDIYKRGASLPMKIKNKYAVEVAFYEKDGKNCVDGVIFKGGKIIYRTNNSWKISLLIRIFRFFNMGMWYNFR